MVPKDLLQDLSLTLRGQLEIYNLDMKWSRESIHVSGLPLLWRGWNGTYTKRDSYVWELPDHTYLGISIRPAKIIRSNKTNRWELWADDMASFKIAIGPDTDYPMGIWNNCLVTTTSSLSTWWQSNSTFVIATACVVLAICTNFF